MKLLYTVFIAALFMGLATICAVAQGEQTVSPELLAILDDPAFEQATPEIAKRIDVYVSAHPDNGIGYALRCFITEETALRQGGDASNAFADCEQAAKLSPKSPLVYLFIADAMYDQDRFIESSIDYTKAIDLGQTDRGVFWKRCDAYRRMGELDKALLDCDRQLSLTPNNFYALYARGHLQVERKQYADAITNLNAAIAAKRDLIALYWRGMAYLQLGNYQAAESDFSACVDLGDRAADTFFYRGQARLKLGRQDDAASDFRMAATGYRASGESDKAQRAERLAQAAPSPVPSGSPGACPIDVIGTCFSAKEVAALFWGVHAALDPKDTSVHVKIDLKDRAQLPSYETEWHYAGSEKATDGNPSITIWIVKGLADQRTIHAIEASLILGLADSGYAGPKWKAIYDQTAARDAAQGSNATDPFVYRRRLADQLADFYEKIAHRSQE